MIFPSPSNRSRRHPSTFEKVVKQAEKGRLWKNEFVSEDLKDLINECLKLKAKERLGG